MHHNWNPGDRLVCVDDTLPPPAGRRLFRSWIRAGQVYTMRQLIIPEPGGASPGPGVLLEEIHNPLEPISGMEYGYLSQRFEKLEEGTIALPQTGSKTAVLTVYALRDGKLNLGTLQLQLGQTQKGSPTLKRAFEAEGVC